MKDPRLMKRKAKLLFYVLLGTVTVGNAQLSDDSYIGIYDNFTAETKLAVTKRRAQAAFTEDIQESVFLSKASPFVNKQWMTKSDFSDKRPFVLDAYINPYISISGNRWTLPARKNKYLIFALFLNPNFEVRIFNDDRSVGDFSKPVRTPSYRPGAELFFAHSDWYKKGDRKNYALSVKGYHHSNGQDGIAVNPIDRPWGKKGYYNTYNGDFSDDFVVELNGLSFWTNDKGKARCFAKLGGSTSTGVSKYMSDYKLYGTQRANFSFAYKRVNNFAFTISDEQKLSARNRIRYLFNQKSKQIKEHVVVDTISKGNIIERFRVEFFASFVLNKMNTGPIDNLSPATFADRINCHLTLHWRIPGYSEAGLFAEAGYYGHDPYNVFFQRSALFYKMGVSFGNFLYTKKTDDLISQKQFDAIRSNKNLL